MKWCHRIHSFITTAIEFLPFSCTHTHTRYPILPFDHIYFSLKWVYVISIFVFVCVFRLLSFCLAFLVFEFNFWCCRYLSCSSTNAHAYTDTYMRHTDTLLYLAIKCGIQLLWMYNFFLLEKPRQNEIESVKIYKRMKVPVYGLHVCLCMSATVSVATLNWVGVYVYICYWLSCCIMFHECFL